MRFKNIVFGALLAFLFFAIGCHLLGQDNMANADIGCASKSTASDASSSVAQSGSEVSTAGDEWIAYIDNEHHLCVQQKGTADSKVIVEDAMEAPCVAGEWVYYLADLDEIDKVKIDGSQVTKVCDTSAFQVYNANLGISHDLNGSTSVTAEYKDGYILYTCRQLKEVGDKQENPPSYYQFDLEQGTVTPVNK